MLPNLNKGKQNIDLFLFAGIDLFEVDEDDTERFVPFSKSLNNKVEKLYYLIFWNEQVLDDLLEISEFNEYYKKSNLEIQIIGDDYFKLVGLNNTNIEETLILISKHLTAIIY